MALLSQEQMQRALEAMREYLASTDDGKLPGEAHKEIDDKRARLIDSELGPLVRDYLGGKAALAGFKSTVDGTNKRHTLWGFKGIKGQMFFNMVVNVADDEAELDQEIKAALTVPTSEEMASSRIKTFHSYVKRLGDQYVKNGHSAHGRPKLGSIPFFLSYFWQLQKRDMWPVYYTNSVNTMVDMNLWQPTGELHADYLAFKHLHEELARAFTEAGGKQFGLYEVEHVFWFKGGDTFRGTPPVQPGPPVVDRTPTDPSGKLRRLPESYVPPVVAVLPRMATGEEELKTAAKASGTSLERAFEKSINAAFTILGYETKLLGQGKGRVPDGVAVDLDNSYAVLWDAKVRSGGYSMGTDDRTIREYIEHQSREMKRRQALRNIYYAVISSTFADDFDDTIRALKMDTNVSEVVLMEASTLVAMVDAKLREPQQTTLGPDGLQRLFTVSGLLTADAVREMVM